MSIDASPEVLAGLQEWRGLEPRQQPAWPDPAELDRIVTDLRGRMPLVFAGEAENLRTQMAKAAVGEAFVLQGGDCAETFADNTADRVRNKMRTLLQMAVVLTYAAGMPVVKIGRMAGQYAKPRSADVEERDGVTLPSYRGDAVNTHEFTAEARRPDPARMLEMYHRSAATLNLMRAFSGGGYADLRLVQRGEEPRDWKPMPSVGKGVREIRVRTRDGAYRVFYAVEDARSVYVLHAFQKKTQKTSKADIDTGKRRYASIP